jgi:uncharacterized protein YcbX
VSGVVTALATTPVKGLRLLQREEVLLTEVGVPDNRCFYLVDERGRMVNGKVVRNLNAVVADYNPGESRLALRFPDGTTVADEVRLGRSLDTRFFSAAATAELVLGPFSDALSEYARSALRLVRADPRVGGVDRGPRGAVSLISEASVQRLSAFAETSVDPRRFRMLVEVSGLDAHAEDSLVGGRARIGEALVAIHGHVGRCLITGHDPETGEPNLPTLEFLVYREQLPTTEPLAFGVYGEVLEPGRVRLGDSVRSE